MEYSIKSQYKNFKTFLLTLLLTETLYKVGGLDENNYLIRFEGEGHFTYLP